MNEPTIEELKKAFTLATDEQLDFVFQIDDYKKSDSIAVQMADAYQISYSEMVVVNEWLKYIFLGLRPVTVAFDNILSETNSDEINIYTYMMQIVDNTPKSLRDLIRNIPFNSDVSSELPGFFDGSTENNLSTSTAINTYKILNELVDIHGNQTTPITKDDILAGIENPTETVRTPSFALPKSKPQTTNILSSLAKPVHPLKSIDQEVVRSMHSNKDIDMDISTIIDPFMKSIGNSTTQTTDQIHVERKEKQFSTTDILSQVLTPKEQNSPAQNILKTLDTKLQQVQGSVPAETYKVADVPRHDPYREIPSM